MKLPVSSWVVLLCVLAIRLVMIPAFPDFRFPDEFWYTEIAQNLLSGNGYVMTGHSIQRFAICKAPGLPFTLAAWGLVFPLTPVSVKVANCLLNWGGIAFLTLAAHRISRARWCAPLTALVAGFHPAVLFSGLTNYPQNGQLFLLGLLVWRLACRDKHAFKSIVRDGVLIGFGALFVPTHIFAVPAPIVFYAISTWGMGQRANNRLMGASINRQRINSSLKSAAALFVGGLIAVSPWLVRNAITEKDFIPFTATSGQQFYTGFNEQAGMNTGTCIEPSEEMLAELQAAKNGTEFESVHWKYALQWVQQHPGKAMTLWGLKFLNWFRWDNGALNTESAGVGGWSDWMQRLSSLFVFGICAVGCLRMWPAEKRWVLFAALLMVANAFGHAFFISRYRYRLPFEPLLLMVGVCGLFQARKRTSRPGAAG